MLDLSLRPAPFISNRHSSKRIIRFYYSQSDFFHLFIVFKDDSPDVPSSMLDVFASRWTTTPLETGMSSEITTNNDSGIPNSWSYLLDERKNERQQMVFFY